MAFPIFVDANIPFYAFGRPHPLKQPCIDVLALIAAHPAVFVTDAEVMQELIHRYLALNLWSMGRSVFEGFAELMRGRIEPMYASDVEHAAGLVARHPGLSARDLIHIAVMERLGLDRIVTVDQGFNRVATLIRLDPVDSATWSHLT